MSAISLQQDLSSQPLPLSRTAMSDAAAMSSFRRLASRQSGLSSAVLCEQQSRLLGPQGRMAMFGRQVAEQGRQASVLNEVPELASSERQEQAERAVDFALGFHLRRPYAENPFGHRCRAFLCVVVYDEMSRYTLAERYAASMALRQLDGEYFIKLIATTRDTVERRIVFHGLLEHFDALLPIERSIYPFNYREVQQEHLHREEALYGRLKLDAPIEILLQQHTPEWLLENLPILNRAAG